MAESSLDEISPCPNCGQSEVAIGSDNEEYCAICGWTSAEDYI